MCAAASAILAALAAPVPRQVQTLPGVEKLSLSDSAGVSAIASANRRDAAIFLNVASRTSVRHPWLLQRGLGSADSPAADAWTLAELSLTVPATGDDVGGSRPSASVGRRLQQWGLPHRNVAYTLRQESGPDIPPFAPPPSLPPEMPPTAPVPPDFPPPTSPAVSIAVEVRFRSRHSL